MTCLTKSLAPSGKDLMKGSSSEAATNEKVTMAIQIFEKFDKQWFGHELGIIWSNIVLILSRK